MRLPVLLLAAFMLATALTACSSPAPPPVAGADTAYDTREPETVAPPAISEPDSTAPGTEPSDTAPAESSYTASTQPAGTEQTASDATQPTDSTAGVMQMHNTGAETTLDVMQTPDTANAEITTSADTKPPKTTPPDTTIPAETTPVKDTTKTPDTTKPPDTTKAPDTTKTPDTTKAPETTLPVTEPAVPTTSLPAFDEAAALKKYTSVDVKQTSHPGALAVKGTDSVIDYSETNNGYISIRYDGSDEKTRIVRISAPMGVVYDYVFKTVGGYEAFPLTEGDGAYTATLYQSNGSKYYALVTAAFTATPDEFAPFLYPSYYVDFNAKTSAVRIAAALDDLYGPDPLDIVYRIYRYVTVNLKYDYDLAKNVNSVGGYIPDLEKIVRDKKGICFDYASLMVAMLRSRGIPAKMVFGYAGDVYHAWINVYSEETGWMNAVIKFDGEKWELADPTFASTGYKNPDDFLPVASDYKSVYVY